MEGLEPTNGTFANSQKENPDKIKSWNIRAHYIPWIVRRGRTRIAFSFVAITWQSRMSE
jgi:hypothetical protein